MHYIYNTCLYPIDMSPPRVIFLICKPQTQYTILMPNSLTDLFYMLIKHAETHVLGCKYQKLRIVGPFRQPSEEIGCEPKMLHLAINM